MSERSGRVMTVLGLVDPEDLGPTLMHEHLVGDYTPPNRRPEPALPITMQNRWQMDYEWVVAPGNVNLTNRQVALLEMQRLVADGGRTLVDVSTPGLVTDPEGLREVSQGAGIHIVRSTGRYTQQFMSQDDIGRSVDEIIRLVQALQYNEAHGEVCPAGWKPGAATMQADPKKSQEYFEATWGKK